MFIFLCVVVIWCERRTNPQRHSVHSDRTAMAPQGAGSVHFQMGLVNTDFPDGERPQIAMERAVVCWVLLVWLLLFLLLDVVDVVIPLLLLMLLLLPLLLFEDDSLEYPCESILLKKC